ncbi:MAG: 16S rRNA (cytosine(1402)-N(4))-methyltransferase RsmH [Armatimonadetes bacterium]|nr:16S rRNA (cytosine(1402)-N(4))-methyltransferase RsmH [Armatimonadota bacterium]
MAEHVSVMLNEVLEALPLQPGAIVVDGTLGLGGHSAAICQKIAPGGQILGFDWDSSMLELGKARLAGFESVSQHFFNEDYRAISLRVEELNLRGKINGILMDLGLNNAQIEDSARGISFRTEGPLDMRMDRQSGEPAAAYLNRESQARLEKAIWEYGDENWAKKIAQVIVQRRKDHPFRTTSDLVDAVAEAIPPAKRDKRIHFATRTFQAIRIAVNHELDDLEGAVRDAARCLAIDGVIVTLSYHSGEDRAVKHAFRELRQEGGFKELFDKPQTPTQAEINANSKSRSAKMRALRRTT